ncbi:DHS-like NAD/FAD-binding domain-containing protein [Trametes polyzona]|nr:DHS-like NAD/FAD-binding domain-containing protein [Trametes polyzona]
MGNQVSTPYEGPPVVLEGKDLPSVAKYMKSPACRNVFVMVGAGVSTAAGIPDFRSPGTGLYSNLQRLNLPYPEAVFEINYFRQNPAPFYTLARELYPGKFRPTLTHTFVKLLADHKLLDTCFTQNIDTLERQAGVPDDKIVAAHGNFASQHCIDCHASFDGAKMRKAIESGDIVKCGKCGGLVKPDIVFFGESLPEDFYKKVPRLRSADLLIIIGTSLTVQPFAGLTSLVPERCPRILINLDRAGDIGARSDDVVLLGRCDETVRKLCKELGWEEELDREWGKTESLKPLDELLSAESETAKAPAVLPLDVTTTPSEPVPDVAPAVPNEHVEDARVDAEVETLTKQIEKGLEIAEGGGDHTPTTVTLAPDSEATSVPAEDKPKPPEAQRVADDAPSEQTEASSSAKEKL